MSEEQPNGNPGEPETLPAVISSPITVAPKQSLSLVPVAILLAGFMIAGAALMIFGQYQLTQKPAPLLLPEIPPDIEANEPPMVIMPPVVSGLPVEDPLNPEDSYDYSGLYKNLDEQVGVQWYQSAIKAGDLGYVTFKPEFQYMLGSARYYEIGTYLDQKIYVLTFEEGEMISSYQALVFIGSGSSTPTLLRRHSPYDFNGEYAVLSLRADVIQDNSLLLKALAIGALQLESGVQLHKRNNFFDISEIFSGRFAASQFNNQYQQLGNKELVEDTSFGPIFRGYTVNPEDGTADLIYGLRTVGGFIVYFEPPLDYVTDDRILNVTWNDGVKNLIPYRTDNMGGCGGGGPLVAVNPIPKSSLTFTGTTVTGRDVYALTDPLHPIVRRIFDMTEGRVYRYDAVSGVSTVDVISVETFLKERGIVVVYDDFGYQNVFVHGEYGPQAECAKPVVYLYPEATTTVTVRVDALVTKSDPAYGTGWTAEAAPNGQLVVNGQSYGSLFWDGYGNGEYPTFTSGFSAPTDEALAVMDEQLAYMGFNKTERTDFRIFWEPHLPDSPYVEWSWIDTRGMQKLAALSIDPRPDTLLRAFVDFKGVDSETTLPPQALEKRDRTGFVVTEWGGLLRR